jgi:hypothetical protein
MRRWLGMREWIGGAVDFAEARSTGRSLPASKPHAVRISRAPKMFDLSKIFARADIVSLRQQCAFSRASSVGHDVRGVDVTGGVLGDPLLWARLAPCLYGYE